MGLESWRPCLLLRRLWLGSERTGKQRQLVCATALYSRRRRLQYPLVHAGQLRYDSLNRISSVNEVHGGPWGQSGTDYVQAYTYDRYGNRTIDQALTTANVPRPNYTVDTNTNRLVAPAGFSYGYDEAGN